MNTFTTRRKLVLGLPLAAALGPAFVRHARAADVPRFALGIASGHPRADGLVLWTRLTGDSLPDQVDVRWELAHDEAFTKIAARGTEVAEAAWAHSVHAEPAGLEPARWYWYRFNAHGQQSAVGRTRTAPAAGADAGTLRFAIASCQRFDHGHFAAWRHLATQELDLVLFLGDYIYEYASPPTALLRPHRGGLTRTLADYRDRYAQYKTDPALQAAHAIAPWMTVWDDHEVDNDYAAGTPQTPDPGFAARRAAATQAYWEHMPFPKAVRPRGTEMRIFDRCDWGTLARIHLLDDRQYRDAQVCPQPGKNSASTVTTKACPALLDPARTLLGTDQERWLAQGWDTQRSWNLVAQQTLMSRMSWTDPADVGTYWTDGWDGYAPARKRLLSTVTERKLGNVVVLGGDVHCHYVSDLKADYDAADAPVVATEFCGSSITSHGMAQSRVDAARGFNPHIHYAHSDQRGYIAFTASARQMEATLMAVADPADPASAVTAAARYRVEAGRPGAQAL